MFASAPGSSPRPTAALHFTPGLIAALEAAGIGHAMLTLHVGAGTFLPVKAEETGDHRMHAEWGRIDAATAGRLNAVREAGGRVIAVGTTSLRLIESATGEDGASFWKRVDETHHLHVAIDMSETADRDNEVVTVIYTRERAIAAGRRRGYRIWGRDEG